MRALSEAERYFNFYQITDGLKDVLRQGWVDRGDPNPESVADHSWNSTVIAITTFRRTEQQLGSDLDFRKIVTMTTIHDLGEIEGDVVVHEDGVLNLEKRRKKIAAELLVQRRLFAIIGMRFYPLIFKEFEMGRTKEAKVAIACEKLDLINRALKAEIKAGRKLERYKDFYVGLEKTIGIIPLYQDIYSVILRRRQALPDQAALSYEI